MEVRLHECTYGKEEIAAATEVLRSTHVTCGEKVQEFESHFGLNAVMVNSGSSANLLAVAALCNPVVDEQSRLLPGDRVIVSALSWATTVWPLVQHGLVPKIVDIDSHTLNIDLEEAAFASLESDVRAIMPVHVYGNPYQEDKLGELGLTTIADCCEALGAEYLDKIVGARSDFATFSFYYSHHITTLEGGMVVCADDSVADLVRTLRSHGWARDFRDDYPHREKYPDIDPRFLFVNAGYNVRPTELNAAIGLIQVPKLAGFVDKRRKAAAMYLETLKPYSHFLGTQKETPGGRSSWHGFPIVVSENAPFKARALRDHFEARGIETRAIICGNIARQPGMQLFPYEVVGDLKHADHVMRSGFSIGCHQRIGEAEVAHVAQVLEDFMRAID